MNLNRVNQLLFSTLMLGWTAAIAPAQAQIEFQPLDLTSPSSSSAVDETATDETLEAQPSQALPTPPRTGRPEGRRPGATRGGSNTAESPDDSDCATTAQIAIAPADSLSNSPSSSTSSTTRSRPSDQIVLPQITGNSDSNAPSSASQPTASSTCAASSDAQP